MLLTCEQARVDFSWIKVVLAATASGLIPLLAADGMPVENIISLQQKNTCTSEQT